VDYTMTCHSGGTLDVYIEPILPKPQLTIFGRSPVARHLATLAGAMNFSVDVLAPGATHEDFPGAEVIHTSIDPAMPKIATQAYVVVSTQGESDEEALEAALRSDARYIGFVASKAKVRKIFDYLRVEGFTTEQLARVHSPAGLNIGAIAPEEIALSILAEIIQIRRRKPQPAPVPSTKPEISDPVCGMTVDTGRAKHFSEQDGRLFYFCGVSCKQKFDSSPEKYLT